MSKKTIIVDNNKTDANYISLQNRITDLEQQLEEYKQLAEKFESVNKNLVESVTRFRLVADYSSDWEMFRDPQNKIIYCSPSIERILGYTPEEYQNLSFADVIHPDDYELAVSAHSRLTQKGESVDPIIFRLIKKTGEFIWVEVYGQTVYTPDGRHIGSRTSTHDINTIKNIEFALKESEDKYKKLFQFMDEGVLRTDKNGYIILANNAFARMLGYNTPTDLIGEHITLLYPFETRAQMIKELDKTGHLLNYEIFTKTKKGEDIYVLCNFKNILNENAEVEYREGIIRDITDLKNIEFALRNSEAKLKETNSTKDKFISILAHDLKSPFNSLIGFSDLLKDEVENDSNENIKQFANTIYEVSTNTYFFLEELLEWARTQQDMVAFNPENIQVIQIADECISLLLNPSKTKNIGIDCEISQDLYVFADRNMLKTILRNLISNAIKFTPKFGQIRITANIKQPFIEIIVSDTGIGMDTNTLQSLFKIDETKSVKGTEGERGTGFGLLLCKEFAEKHGGTICVESKLGKGSDFKIAMPIKLD